MTAAFVSSLAYADQLLSEHYGPEYARLSAVARGALCAHFTEQPFVNWLNSHEGADLRGFAADLMLDALDGVRT